jgi:hypothetical protein
VPLQLEGESGDALGPQKLFRARAVDAAFAADGERLIAGLADHTSLVYDLRSETSDLLDEQAITEEQLVDAWRTLAHGLNWHKGNRQTWQATDTLLAGRDKTVEFFAARMLEPIPEEFQEMDQLVDRLVSDDLAVREAAAEIVADLGDNIWTILDQNDVPTAKLRQSAADAIKAELRGNVQSRRSGAPQILAQIATPAAIDLLLKVRERESDNPQEKFTAQMAVKELAKLETLRAPADP